MGMNILAGLLDEKIIKVISLFMKYPEKRFYLSEIARLANVNTATTFRILNKITTQNLVNATVIGKARTYQLAKGERVQSLSKMLKRDDSNALDVFCERIAKFPRIILVLINSKAANEAKLIIVGEFSSKDRIERIAADILDNHKFKINFVEFSVQQYKDMRALGMIGDKKVLYRKPSGN